MLVAALVAVAVLARADEIAPTWAVDRGAPGPTLPPVGRSLFDAEFSSDVAGEVRYAVPFPFATLLERLVARSGGQVRAVLIPIGRSLQRSAASPKFFESPRVVVAVVGDASGDSPDALSAAGASPASAIGGGPLNDRLFLGYQERAAIIEVISYNEDAGRFEFQVVENYRAGAEPRVVYAERSTCAACHQGLAPIFSRPLWDETNANADVARRLAIVGTEFHGVPAALGVDVPDAMDAATDRAGRFALYQRIWSEGCGPAGASATQCRADLLGEALRYKLAGRHWRGPGSRRAAIAAHLTQRWTELWPGGLAVTDPDIPNRRLELFASVRGPLDLPGELQHATPLDEAATLAAAVVLEQLEPFVVRAPLEVWSAQTLDAAHIDEIIAGLASFVSERDVAELNRRLASNGSPRAIWRVACTERALDSGAAAADEVRVRLVCGDGFHATLPGLDASLVLTTGGGPGSSGAEAGRAEAAAGRGVLQRLALPEIDELRGRPITLERDEQGRDRLSVTAARGTLRVATGDAVRVTILRRAGSQPMLDVELLDDFTQLADAADALVARALDDHSAALSARPFRRSVVLGEILEHLNAASPRGERE